MEMNKNYYYIILTTLAIICFQVTNSFSSVLIDFENQASNTLIRNQYQQLGVVFSGGYWSGRVMTEGDYGTANFGNSSNKIVHAGARNFPTTLTFVNPSTGQPTTAKDVHILMGDGNIDAETFTVKSFDGQNNILSTNTYTTYAEGLLVDFPYEVAKIELRLEGNSYSGVNFDDVSFNICSQKTIDFEDQVTNTLIRSQYQQLGVVFSGGYWSGRVMTEGDYDTANFGNSSNKIAHAGERNSPTTLTFVDPSTGQPTTATDVHILMGDGNIDAETFTVTAFDDQNNILSQNTYTTYAEGLWVDFPYAVAKIELKLEGNSYSGVNFDDVSFTTCN